MEDIGIIYEKYKESDEDRFTEEFNWENYLLDEEGGKCIDYSRGSGKGSALGMGNEDGTGDGGTDEYKWYVYESYGWDVVSVNGQETMDIDDSPIIIYCSHGGYSRCDRLNPDLTLSPCYAVDSADGMICGNTLREAIDNVNKMYEEDFSIYDYPLF